MGRPLGTVLKDIIRLQGLEQDPIANIYGTPIVFPPVAVLSPSNGTWVLFYLDAQTMFSPDDIVSKLTSVNLHSAPILTATNGVLNYSSQDGTTMLSTSVNSTQAISVPVGIDAPGKQIRLYVGESLVRTAVNGLNVNIAVPAGTTPIHIVTYGTGTTSSSITLPQDLRFSVGNTAPPAPRWVDSGAINSTYIDPKTGMTGVTVNWFNQEGVGGWGVYVVGTTPYGNAISILPQGNNLIIQTSYSGITPPFESSVVQIGNIPIGTVQQSYASDATQLLTLVVNAFNDIVDYSVIASGIVNVLSFRNIADIDRSSTNGIMSFTDYNVQIGQNYSYCLDSYSPIDTSIRSNKSLILTVTAGDTFPPGSVTINNIIIQGTNLTVYYNTPSDLDYYATKAIYYYQGSGVGTITNTTLVNDAGVPNTSDSLSFDISNYSSGTVYLCTVDLTGNVQYVFSGVPFFYNTNGFILWHGPLLYTFGGSSGAVLSGTLNANQNQIINIGTGNSFFTATGQLEIDLTTGTSPLIIASQTKVTNLNADLLDGLNSTAFAQFTADGGFNVLGRFGVTGSTLFSGTVSFNSSIVGAPSTSIVTIQDNVTGGLLNLGSDGVGQTHITWGGSGHIDGQGAQLEIFGTAGNGVGIYSLASNTAAISLLANGQIGMNTNSPKSVFHVVTSGNAGFVGYAVIQSDPGVAYGGGLLLTNNTSQNAGAGSWKMTSTFDNVVGRARWGWIYNTAPEVFINSGAVFEIGPNGAIGWVGTAFNTTMLQNFSGPMTTLIGVGQRFATYDAQSNSLSTTSSDVIVLRGGTQAAAYTTAEARALHIFDAVKGAGSTITTQVGIRIDNQTQGGTNNAIITGTGPCSFGDAISVNGLTTTSSLFVGSVDPGSGTLMRIGAAGRSDFRFYDSSAATDAKTVDFSMDGQGGANTFNLLLRTDAFAAGNRIFSATRSAATLTTLALAPDGGTTTFGGDITVSSLGSFDHTATPTKDYLLSWNATVSKWQPRLVQIGFNSGQVTSAPTSSGFSGDNSQSAIVNTVTNPTGTPGVMSGSAPVLTPIYNGMIIDLSTSYPAGLQPGFVFVVDYSISSGTTWTNGAMLSTATKIVHAGLNQNWGYEYRYVVSGSSATANSPTSAITKPSAQSETNAYGLIVASQIATINLSSISANIGDISAGQLRNSVNTAGILFSNSAPTTWTQGIFFAGANPPPGTVTGMYIDFTATGSRAILHHTGLNLNADGSAVFSGTIFGNTLSMNGNLSSVIGNLFIPTMANFGPSSTVVFSGSTTIAGSVSIPNTILGAVGVGGSLTVGGSILFDATSSTGGMTITDNGTNLFFNFSSSAGANSINFKYTNTAGGKLEISNGAGFADIITFTGSKIQFNVTPEFDATATFSPDNTIDIGQFGANRARTLYLASDLSVQRNFGIVGNTVHSGTTVMSGITMVVNNLFCESGVYVNSGTLRGYSGCVFSGTVQIQGSVNGPICFDGAGTSTIRFGQSGTGTKAMSLGSNGVPQINNPNSAAAWVTVQLPNGTNAYMPVWQ